MEMVQTNIDSERAKILLALLRTEWEGLGEFESLRAGIEIPKPIVGIASNCVQGGASFTADIAPEGNASVVWLNTVFVKATLRGQGLASKLIVEAQRISPALFALTDIPELYTKLGWCVRNTNEHGVVVCTAAAQEQFPPSR